MLPDPIFLNVHMYGVMIAVGILIGFWCLTVYSKKLGIDDKFIDFVYFNGIGAIAVGFGAAAVFQATYNYIENPAAGFRLGGGITFLGGLIGGVVFFLGVYFLFRRRLTGRVMDIVSLAPCIITVAHAFGRIGCFFAGCCYGRPTDSFLGVKFPHLSVKVHPTQLYEAAFLFILFGVLSYLILKKRFRHNMSVYLISYGVFRFINEILRNDSRGQLVAGLTPSQFWAIMMVVLGVALIFPLRYFFNKREAEKAAIAAAKAGIKDDQSTDEN